MELGEGFVGRTGEVDLLRARLEEARAGHGRLVLVTGEPGIGKTSLAQRLAAAAGMPVGWGRASDDEGSPPYWIFRQLTRSLGRPFPIGGTDGSAEERFAAFEAFAEDVREAAAPHGLLAVLDDLQWADAASLALLVHLARDLARAPLMIVATYRDTETTGRDALTAALAALAREPVLSRIRLAGLTEPEVAEQLTHVGRGGVPEDVAALVSRRSGGNPFFVTELARLLDSADTALPDGVVDTVRARLGRLSEPCRALVATAAVLGSELDPAALAEVAARPVGDVLTDLDEASDAGIVTAGRFGHDLIREAAQLSMPTAARLAAHARMGAWLEARDAARTSEIAHHWLESLPVGDPARAAAWAERAADQALSQFAWERAADLYRRALDVAPASAADRTRLLRKEGVAHLRDGDVQHGSKALAAAADAAREAGDPAALGETGLAIEGLSDPWGNFNGAKIAREALAAMPSGDDPLRARLLALHAGEAGFLGDDEAEPASAEALAMAERLGDPDVLRSALRARQMVRASPDGVHERLGLAQRMFTLGEKRDDADAMLWGRLWRFDALLMLGRLDEAEGELAAIRVLAAGLSRPLARWHALRSIGALAFTRGRFDEVIEMTRESLALVAGRAHFSLQGVPASVLAAVAGYLGREDLVEPPMVKIFTENAPRFVVHIHATYLLHAGDREGARELFAATPSPDPVPVPVRLPSAGAAVELGAAFDAPDLVAKAAAILRPHADLMVTGGAGAIMANGSVRRYLGLAAASGGQLDEAVREFRRAIAVNDDAGTPPFAALARFELAEVLARRRRPNDAEESLALAASASAAAARLGMTPLRRDADALAASLRGDVPGPLTRREREVATHLADGLTNKQIASLLHISERTAESHVQHILAKLGLANRAQIATWATTNRQP